MPPVSRAKGRAAVVGLVALTAAAVGVVDVYLPFFSQTAKDRRENPELFGPTAQGGRAPGIGPSSMWSNIDKAAKRNRDAATAPAAAPASLPAAPTTTQSDERR
uniref:Uncharacterized protein n=1 Tax=Bicosoecida sp. CB-2014 TaxID=1486930 RepID=A0A7S1G569_9STRA|mmetsp:Transcript_1732/g.5442  ORF Transcript_1732/g.5442 Transcript_1732/m.5442 type:complete len:104 (+) Transcript_1732:118-429(+)